MLDQYLFKPFDRLLLLNDKYRKVFKLYPRSHNCLQRGIKNADQGFFDKGRYSTFRRGINEENQIQEVLSKEIHLQ